MKHWETRAIEYLRKSLKPIPQELNEIDWKSSLSEKNEKLSRHLSAFANHPGGGFLIFGIEDKTVEIIGIARHEVNTVIERLSSLCRDTLDPKVKLDSAFCEERGSGFEKVVMAIELYGLPPLKLEEIENSFKATIYAPKKFADMTENERIEACCQHAIIQYYANGGMTNASLRQRFKMNDKQASQISRLINLVLENGKIKIKNPENSSREFSIYVPYWA